MKKFLATACVAVLLTACSCGNKVAGSGGSASVVPTDMAIGAGAAANELNKVGDRVFFAFDQSSLSKEAKDTLDKQSSFMKQNSSTRFIAEGHTDDRGTRDYNLGLGERRAHSAKHYLIQKGVSPDHISTVSYGKERPAVPGNNEEAWKQNRRVVTKIAE